MSKFHRCFDVTTPAGHTARIRGNPEMPQETLDALMRMMDLAYEQFSSIEMAGNASEDSPTVPVRASHTFVGVSTDEPADPDNWICAAYNCSSLHLPGKRYCKKHDMRFRRHGNPETILKPGRKKQN